jgi:hypothetical protein
MSGSHRGLPNDPALPIIFVGACYEFFGGHEISQDIIETIRIKFHSAISHP